MSFSVSDTITAISTPLGIGGIGIIRVSGDDAINIVDRVFKSKKGKPLSSSKSHTIHYGHIVNSDSGEIIDEVLVSLMKAPYSYTREDTVEINCHGGYQSLSKTLNLLLSKGARLANPGEFTMRAFLNGRIDLSQAEAVMDLINSRSDLARKNALLQLEGSLHNIISEAINQLIEMSAMIEAYIDFPEEDITDIDKNVLIDKIASFIDQLKILSSTFDEGRLLREGICISIIGKPNVGKSSLLNRLLLRDRAIVTDFPGTTRDIIEEHINIKGIPIKIIDTAGIRDTSNEIEKEGIRRSMKAIETADLILALFDSSEGLTHEDLQIIESIKGRNFLIVFNKCDIANKVIDKSPFEDMISCEISALTGMGIEELKEKIFTLTVKDASVLTQGDFVITNDRHKALIDDAVVSLQNAHQSITSKAHLEITSMHIRASMDYLGEIVGTVTADDILNKIFNSFCIGK